jgi:ABC-type uncharacterized transport system substrate-binding protein
MKRRDFIALAAGAAGGSTTASAQQRPAMSTIAYLTSRSADSDASMLVALRRGLAEAGYVEGQNLAIEYRFADGQYDRLPAQVTELIRQRVAVIVFAGARGASTDAVWQQLRASQIPVVFNVGLDPVQFGLVASINRPGGNFTGVSTLVGELTAKNIGLLRELVPNAATIALLADTQGADPLAERDARAAAATFGARIVTLSAATDSEIDAAFAGLGRQPVDAMAVATNPFYVTRAKQITTLAAHYRVPTIYARREFAVAGGLVSYGYSVADSYRQMGNYAARILKGEKPADLPVVQPSKFELLINLKTAKAFGLDIPARLLALSDEVIE